MPTPRIVIIGGGFGGLYTAQHLKNAPAQITLIDRRNFHLFQPLLYQVATGGLSPANIAAPLRSILKRQRNTEVLLAEVTSIDPKQQLVHFADGESIHYDSLVVATGASHNYFGNDQWSKYAPGLKSIEDATEIRRKVLMAFETAEREPDPIRRKALLRFVVVGGGPTGVELAGTLGEISRETLKHDFRHINPAEAEILLVEALDRILTPYDPSLSEKAKQQLEALGVKVMLKTMVTDIQETSLRIKYGEHEQTLETHNVLWGAGVQASPLGAVLNKATGVALDRAGRVTVEPDMSIPGYPNLFVIGDMSLFLHQNGKPLPGVAQAAMQQGKYVAQLIQARLSHPHHKSAPFSYFDKGSMSTIGRSKAVAQTGSLKFSGWIAWMMWLFIHVLFLVRFENQILVLLQWAGNYVTRNRSARLITGEHHELLPEVTPTEAVVSQVKS